MQNTATCWRRQEDLQKKTNTPFFVFPYLSAALFIFHHSAFKPLIYFCVWYASRRRQKCSTVDNVYQCCVTQWKGKGDPLRRIRLIFIRICRRVQASFRSFVSCLYLQKSRFQTWCSSWEMTRCRQFFSPSEYQTMLIKRLWISFLALQNNNVNSKNEFFF